ncbi:MAG: hypothetical protein ABL901_03250 [Hyphomicrobiaceae bacterium]
MKRGSYLRRDQRMDFRLSDEHRKAIQKFVSRDRISKAELLARMVEAYSLMYPGADYVASTD